MKKFLLSLIFVVAVGGVKAFFYFQADREALSYAYEYVDSMPISQQEKDALHPHIKAAHRETMRVVYKTNSKFRFKDEIDYNSYRNMFDYYLGEAAK